MAQKFYTKPPVTEIGTPVIAKNSVQFSEVDPVVIDENGFLKLATVGSKILGFANEAKTVTSDNQTVAKYKPQYIPALKVQVTYPSNVDGSQVNLNGYKDFDTVTTGAFRVSLTAITGGQLRVIKFDPYDISANNEVAVMVAEPQDYSFAQP